jgi:cellulose synthase/poly-beta-1,6-N-acetylglucosamine synthase-like glycosyltransferase
MPLGSHVGTPISILLIGLGCLATIPGAVFLLECLFGASYRPRRKSLVEPRQPRTVVLVPAHDESAAIASTVTALRRQLGPGDVVLVVADNCSDDTAKLAQANGASVIERHDAAHRGKGYALAFGIEHLASAPPEVVVIVDADCQVSPGGIQYLAQLAQRHHCPVQADYVLTPPEQPSGHSVVSALAFFVKNRVRPRGLAALGLPCLLTGTGMAFPWEVLRKAPPTRDHLVEDMLMGLQLAELGHAPRLATDAHVTSAMPQDGAAATAQRRRWEHGHIATIVEHAPRLLSAAIRRRQLGLLALALDLLVPPLSLFVLALVVGAVACALALLVGASPVSLWIFLGNLGAIGIGVLVGWFACGRELVRPRDLLAVPRYIAWKVPLYFSFFTRGRQRAWERTQRSGPPHFKCAEFDHFEEGA